MPLNGPFLLKAKASEAAARRFREAAAAAFPSFLSTTSTTIYYLAFLACHHQDGPRPTMLCWIDDDLKCIDIFTGGILHKNGNKEEEKANRIYYI
jgi:hypothetical protein